MAAPRPCATRSMGEGMQEIRTFQPMPRISAIPNSPIGIES